MKYFIAYFLLLIGITTNAQSLVSVAPSTGVAGTSVSVTITGSGTTFTSNTIFVLSSGTSILTVTDIVAVSATQIQATINIPANATAGNYKLSTLAGFTPIQLSNAFTVTGGGTSASIVSVSPNEGHQGQVFQMSIYAEHTLFSAASSITASLVKVGGTPIVIPIFAVSDTMLAGFLSIPGDADLGFYSLVVTTSNDGILTLSNGFNVTADPRGILSALEPNEGNNGDTVSVLLEGLGTSFTQMNDLQIELLGTSVGGILGVRNIQVLSDSTLSFDIIIPLKARSGMYDLFMHFDTIDFLILNSAFTVIGDSSMEAQLVSVTPASANQGQTLDVLLMGKNTSFTDSSGMDIAIFDQDTFIQPDAFIILNDSVIKATFTIPSDFPIGVYSVGLISDADGYLELTQSFTVIENTGIRNARAVGRKLSLYPNPAKEYLRFEPAGKLMRVAITDVQGKRIEIPEEDWAGGVPGSYTINLLPYQLHRGIYFIQVETDQGIQYQKFIVQ